MKRFIANFIMCAILIYVFLFFGGFYIFGSLLGFVLFGALVVTLVIQLFIHYEERIEELNERIKQLEEKESTSTEEG